MAPAPDRSHGHSVFSDVYKTQPPMLTRTSLDDEMEHAADCSKGEPPNSSISWTHGRRGWFVGIIAILVLVSCSLSLFSIMTTIRETRPDATPKPMMENHAEMASHNDAILALIERRQQSDERKPVVHEPAYKDDDAEALAGGGPKTIEIPVVSQTRGHVEKDHQSEGTRRIRLPGVVTNEEMQPTPPAHSSGRQILHAPNSSQRIRVL